MDDGPVELERLGHLANGSGERDPLQLISESLRGRKLGNCIGIAPRIAHEKDSGQDAVTN